MKTRILAPVALALVLALPALAQDRPPVQGPPGQPPERRMTFTFRGAAIQTFLGYLSREAGFTFIFESQVTGEITAIAEQPVTRDQALEILRAWLLPKQKTLHRTGDIVRIMSLEEAKRRGLPVKIGSDPAGIADTDELITQVLTLRYVKAGDVKTELSGLLSDKGSLMGEGTSNTLVITDTSASIRRFAEVLAALDKAVTAELHVRVFKLKNARADEVATIVSDLFEGSSALGGGGNQGGGGRGGRGGRGGGGGGGGPGGGFQEAARMFFGGGGGGGGAAATGGAQTTSVNVSSDARTNSVVVTATTDQLRLVEELVKDLDADPDEVVTTLKAIPLVNADATSLAKTLETLFADDTTTSQQQNQRGGGGGGRNFFERMQAAGGNQGNQSAAEQRYAPKPRFTTDTRTNTIIVSATQADLTMIEQLAKDLDKDATEMSGVLVLPLQHAEATEIATVLQQVLQNSATTQAGGGGNNAANEGRAARQARQAASAGGGTSQGGESGTSDLVGNVTVTADDGSNALVFTSSPKNFSRLRALVAELDVVRREVFIECLIAEVQLNDRGELGIQWSQAFTNSIENAEEGTQNLGTDFGLDALQDGLRYTTTSDKLTGLLRALRTEGRLNILSTPKILALENAAAEISVGQEVPYVTNSRVTQNGDTVNTIQYRDVGVILRVTPQVSDAGAVTLVVHPEVSSISPDSQSVQISEGVRSPTFNKEFADTTIIVHAGQTAVIGGLIRDTFTETFRSIPYLGDIPILGRLFGATTREKIKQEIVVFLTPHVIESPGQLARVSQEQVAQYAYVPTEVMQDELDRWLKNLQEGSHSFLYNRGTVLLESGRIDDAIETLEKARDLDPQDPATRLNLGLAFARAGLLAKAQEELGEAERLAPGDADIAWDLGCVLWRRGDVPRAARNFERVLLLDPAHQEAQRWLPKARRELERISRELTGVGVNPPTPIAPTPDGTKGQGTPPVPGPEGQKK